jgi:hypothetical protein
MASLMDLLGESLDDRTVGQIGRQIGADPQTTQGAISAAIPVIVAALARNASDPAGASIAKLLAMLAPIVMAALAKKRGQEGLDTGGLTDLLGGERDRMQEQSPDAFGAITGMLDANNDGSIADDVARMGGGLLGSLFGKR